ncbi:MAG TPA: thioredoxin domain-containing protein [Solirubrobacteraceae bacterium]|jgi:hypothetical protein|nr:thioredoxin domain-containing protein [Solirubrobacteraceae bacterium]
MTNALADEVSPYLRQHAHNPVDWLPWGDEALARARERDRPLLVSIGYAACHWCHVMERESFEDAGVAELMNTHFVCVKVDREERPDVDALYMEAVQTMTGQGGWPLNVFLTPAQVPFYGGTYFPPSPRHGLPSWPQVLSAVAEAWSERREELEGAADRLRERLGATARMAASAEELDPAGLDQAVNALAGQFDRTYAGFGGAPKFPPSSVLSFLLRRPGRAPQGMVLETLRAMAHGGIFDLLGGGFHRYAVDRTWTVPHFEKMLYDNALLAPGYLRAWQLTGEERLLRTCRETLDWALAEMQGAEGGFYSSLDADSEGIEGLFYTWTVGELRDALGERADAAIGWLGASEDGNFSEGGRTANVLRADGAEPPDREALRARLLEARSHRVRPATDDKRILSWNALMLGALAEAGAVLCEPRYVQAAERCADFLLRDMRDAQGHLLRVWGENGGGRLAAYLEDHAFLLEALLTLYEATLQERWFTAAVQVADAMLARFADPERGGFFTTADDAPGLIVRRRDVEDSPIPSGSSGAAMGLLRLAALTGEERYEAAARSAIALVQELAPRHPQAFGHLLSAIDFALGPVSELALVGEDLAPMLDVVRARPRPHLVLAGGDGSGASAVPLLRERPVVDGQATAYLCERFVCQAPVTTPAELERLLSST